MSHHPVVRTTLLAMTLAVAAPAAWAAREAPEGEIRLAQMQRPSSEPSARPTATPMPLRSPVPTPLPVQEEPIQRGTEPTSPYDATGTEDMRPFSLTIGAAYEFGSASSGGVAGNAQQIPTQLTSVTNGVNAWSGFAEVGLGAFSLGAKYIQYGGVESLTMVNPAGGTLPFYWPQEAWSAYGRLGVLKLGYLNEYFGRGIGDNGAIGSVFLGLGSSVPILADMLDLDWGLMGGWGVIGQGPGHIPAEAKLGLSLGYGPLRVSGGYVGRVTFTGAPGAFVTALTNPADLTTGDVATVNATRFGTYQGPYLGLRLSF